MSDICNKIRKRADPEMNEETVCTQLIIPFVTEVLGWDITNVEAEYTLTDNSRPDYALLRDGSPEIVIEAKSQNTKLRRKRDEIFRYLRVSEAEVGMLTDGIKYEVFEGDSDEPSEVFELGQGYPEMIESAVDSGSIKLEQFESLFDRSKTPVLPEHILDALKLQVHSANENLKPIHLLLVCDSHVYEEVIDFIKKSYYSVCVAQSETKGIEYVRKDKNPIVYVINDRDGNTVVKDAFPQLKYNYEPLPAEKPVLYIKTPRNGLWTEYEEIAPQIDFVPHNLSRFDLIFAPKDKTDDEDYFNGYTVDYTHNFENNWVIDNLSAGSEKQIPENTDEHLCDFFVENRSKGIEDSIPVTGKMIDSLYKITKTISHINQSRTSRTHAERATTLMMESLKDVGFDEDEGRFDVDMTEANQSSSQRKRRNTLVEVIKELEDEGEKGAPKDMVIETMVEKHGFEEDEVEYDIVKMGREAGEIYEPRSDEICTL